MGQVYVDENSLYNIGNAIRNITNTTNNFYPNQMGPVIENISMGPEITDCSYLFESGGGDRGHNQIQFESIINCLSSNLSDTSHMFTNVSTPTREINSGNFPLFDTSNVTNMSSMFYGYRLDMNIPNYNTSKVTDMSYMFGSCDCLKVEQIENFDTSNVTNMSGIFSSYYLNYFTNIPNWNYSNVKDISRMFERCAGRAGSSIPLPNKFGDFDISNISNMSYMFNSCNFFTNEICNFIDTGINNNPLYSESAFENTVVNSIHDLDLHRCKSMSTRCILQM